MTQGTHPEFLVDVLIFAAPFGIAYRSAGFADTLSDLARLPETEIVVRAGEFEDRVSRVPQADLSIFGLVARTDFGRLYRLVELSASTCLFVRDSGQESVLA